MDTFGHGRPLRARAKRTLAAKFLQELDRQGQAPTGGKPAKARLVPFSRHEERENDSACLLSSALQDELTPNCLLRVVSKQQCDLHFFARAHSENFDKSVKGISIFRRLADKLRITDKEVELQEVKEEEAKLDEVVLIISDRYLSKRDIWHAHLAMMQHGGQLLYSNYDHNLRQHMPSSRVEELIGGPKHGPVACGQVTAETNVTFKSGSSNMFLMIQVSSDLWTYGLSGRPYWDVLVECFAQLLEKSLRVSSSNTSGHYLTMVLFARARGRRRQHAASSPNTQESPVGMDDKLPIARNPLSPTQGRASETAHEDFYDVFWEGFAKNMPPPQQLIARVRQVFIGLQEQSFAKRDFTMSLEQGWSGFDDGPNAGIAEWRGIHVDDILEASRGNTLECLNVALNHYDQHHLDRMLKVTGQPIILLTAGNGLINSASLELYELTHYRFTTAGPTGFHMICVRDPPLHAVPWVTWPGGPAPSGAESEGGSDFGIVTSSSFVGEHSSMLPPSSPPWVEVHFYPEVTFRNCSKESNANWKEGLQAALSGHARRGTGWITSCLLPLEEVQDMANAAPLLAYVPDWDDGICNLEAPVLSRRPTYSDSFQAGSKAECPRHQFVTAKLWESLRFVHLRPYYQHASPMDEVSGRKKIYQTEYLVEPNRFYHSSITSDEASVHEQMAVMNDLIGLRLELFPQIDLGVHNQDRQLSVDLAFGRGKDIAAPISDPWVMQGNLIPEKLHSLALKAPNGMQWTVDPRGTGLAVSFKDQGVHRKPLPELTHRYTGFFVRRHLVRIDASDEQRGFFDHVSRESDAFWLPSRCVFHPPMQLETQWNGLDTIIAGNLPMPPALPYPVQRSSPKSSTMHDRCSGWKLNRAVKQHFFMLVPQDAQEHSHQELLAAAIQVLGGNIELGVDPFETLEGFQEAQRPFTEARHRSIERFRELKRGLEELCFGSRLSAPNGGGSSPLARGDAKFHFDLDLDINGTSYEIQCKQSTVYIKDTSVASAFRHSRDWFELFYDSKFAPPKFFHLVMQWIVCSSVHLVNFVTRLSQLAKDHGFFLVRVPIAQLFPQPAPPWVWGDDRETNLDRPVFYPRRRIPFPPGLCTENRRQLHAHLLTAWVQTPLSFVFFFSSPVKDFKCVATPDSEATQPQVQHQVFQRLKGWVLSEPEGLCLIALREENIYWYENRLLFSDLRDFRMMDQRLQRVDELRHAFYTVTEEILSDAAREQGLEHRFGDSSDSLCRPPFGSDTFLPRERGPTDQSSEPVSEPPSPQPTRLSSQRL